MDVEFTHVRNLTGYMQRVVHRLSQEPPGRILDVPAGAGQVSEALRSLGHEVVSGDINEDQEHFVKVDLEGAFPFETDSFDVAICLEGIEHVLNGV